MPNPRAVCLPMIHISCQVKENHKLRDLDSSAIFMHLFHVISNTGRGFLENILVNGMEKRIWQKDKEETHVKYHERKPPTEAKPRRLQWFKQHRVFLLHPLVLTLYMSKIAVKLTKQKHIKHAIKQSIPKKESQEKQDTRSSCSYFE